MDIEKTEGNKLIAEFMGWEERQINGFLPPNKKQQRGSFYRIWAKLHPLDLKYHKSWEWLMPVVKKIGDIIYGDFEVREELLNISKDITMYNDTFYICPDSIERVYKSVIQFIKWYNNQEEK